MHIQKNILILTTIFLVTAVPAFSKLRSSAPANKVSGKVKVTDNGTSVWVEFEVTEAKKGQTVSGFFRRWLDDESKQAYAEVVYMKVDGKYAWLAGKCTRDSGYLAGRWFFMAVNDGGKPGHLVDHRSEEHTSELQSHSFISYAVFCLKKKKKILYF